jgi:sterol desaturase/sphingolipid hydroxylase (fatty acid hydroxylase superfamily)
VLIRKRIEFKKIQRLFPAPSDYRREIQFSVLTTVIFTIIGFSTFHPYLLRPYTQIYDVYGMHGVWYEAASFILVIFVHDTYFYWTHRAMHSKWGMKYVHLVHHKSTNPSPWASFSFHPLEAVVEAGIIVVIVMLFPIHRNTVLLFMLFMTIYNVYGHLGWELYPKRFHRSIIGKWVNTSVNHNQHHKKFEGNYGLYFLFWDRWLGTIRDDYDAAFEEVADRQASQELTHF